MYTSSTGVNFPYSGNNITKETNTLPKEPETSNNEDEKLECSHRVMKTNSKNTAVKAF